MNPDVLQELGYLRELGYTHLDLSVARPKNAAPDAPAAVETAPDKDSADAFEALRREAHNCQSCRLAGTRTNVVFGVGNPNADLMFIGEAPGRDEDEKGEPFVGRAGQ